MKINSEKCKSGKGSMDEDSLVFKKSKFPFAFASYWFLIVLTPDMLAGLFVPSFI